jgi:uncharacterized protein (TIGR02265 family)
MSAVEARQELEQRLAVLTPEDTVRGLFFRGVQEAVLELRGPAAVEECFAECGERKFVDFFAYSGADFLRLLRRTVGLLDGKNSSFEGTLRRLGNLGTSAILRSPAGQAVRLIVSGTPRRILESLPMAYAMTSPAGGACKVALTGPTSGRILFERDVVPCSYVVGSLETHFLKEGARGLRISGRVTGPLSSEYELSWE